MILQGVLAEYDVKPVQGESSLREKQKDVMYMHSLY